MRDLRPDIRADRAPLTVMQVVLSLAPGGTERLVIEICRRLEGAVRSVVCCLDDEGGWASELTGRGIPVVALRRAPGFHPSLGRQIARIAREHGADALHCHHYSPFVYGAIAACVSPRLRVVFTEHGRLSDAPPSAKRGRVNPLLGRLPARICAVSADLKTHMVAEGFPEHRVAVVYNGIEIGTRPSTAQRTHMRRALGLPADAKTAGTIARLDPVKNLVSLIDAHAAVAAVDSAAHLVIVGDGPERALLEERSRALGIDHLVRFAGYRADARDVLAAFDVYVNSSTHEGVSLTILEAMAAVLPVVATRVGGNPEVVIDNETGLLVPSKAPAALASAIASLLGDAHRRHAMGEVGRWRVKQHFAIERMVDEYHQLYQPEGRARKARHDDDLKGDWRQSQCVESQVPSRFSVR